jgi:tetratricopeptide (TPR) repeat protein
MLEGLAEERSFLLRSLDDLDREVAAGDLDALDATTLRDDYTRRLAEVQRAIEEEGVAADPATTEVAAGADRRPARSRRVAPVEPRRASGFGRSWVKRAVAGVIVAGLAGGAGLGVAASMGQRRAGDTITGNTPETTASLLDQAAKLSDDGKALEAVQLYDKVLDRQPQNVEALAERGFLLLRVAASSGETPKADLVKQGKASIELALQGAPGDPRLLFYRGVAEVLEGNDAAANATFDQALASNPSPDVKAAVDEFRQGSTTATTTPAAGSAPPG